jgi:integrase
MWKAFAMSSLQKTKTGYRLQFRLNKKAQTLSLGKIRKPEAESFKLHFDRLVLANKGAGKLTLIDVGWLADMPDELRGRLKATGLIAAEPKAAQSFVGALDDYAASMQTWENSTIKAWRTHRRRAFLFFANRPFGDITAGDARDFKQFMLSDPMELAENSARKTIGCCRQVCQWLIDHERLTKNPFGGQPVGIGKAKNQGYVSAEQVERILPSCPNNEWRLLFVFARFAGMRCPSEPFKAKWSFVDWDRGRMLVEAPKKKDTRVIPLFPELRKYLEEYQADLPEGASDWMLPNLRLTSGSLHAPATKIIMRAKLELWPRLFHNLRSSCQTDLADKHPLAAVCAWLGNSATVAARHYLQVTEAHFEAATKTATLSPEATTSEV